MTTTARTTRTSSNGVPAKRPRATLEPSENAKALYRWLETEWDRMGVLPTLWCRQHGIPDPTVLRWKNDTEPDFRNLKRVADALGRSILDILVAGNWITEAEANGHVPQPIVVDARQAIRMDPNVGDVLEEALLQMMDNYADIEANIARRIETRTTKARRGARSSSKAS